jgi:probable rRNA maturation factor
VDGHGLDVTVNADLPEVDRDLLRRAAAHVAAAEGHDRGELSVTLVSDEEIRAINRAYLARDYVTDVMAFSLGDADALLADVYVGLEQARRQARELGVDPEEELVRLVVHGVLHVTGHDHPEGPERAESPMFRRQEALLREILGR